MSHCTLVNKQQKRFHERQNMPDGVDMVCVFRVVYFPDDTGRLQCIWGNVIRVLISNVRRRAKEWESCSFAYCYLVGHLTAGQHSSLLLYFVQCKKNIDGIGV